MGSLPGHLALWAASPEGLAAPPLMGGTKGRQTGEANSCILTHTIHPRKSTLCCNTTGLR
eukprot:3151643-Amphidinium_carterae.2